MPVALIADIVGSRRLPDREGAQRILDETIARVESEHPLAIQQLQPTVGDEQQALYPDLASALGSVLLLQLALPDGIQCRFGLGIGAVNLVTSAGRTIPEGPGWWSAREAIDLVRAKQQRTAPAARTWIVVAPEEDEGMHATARIANAYLLTRDALVGAMGERARRLTYGRCGGATQRELAEREGISQPAVSQLLAGAGAASLIEGYLALGSGAAA